MNSKSNEKNLLSYNCVFNNEAYLHTARFTQLYDTLDLLENINLFVGINFICGEMLNS